MADFNPNDPATWNITLDWEKLEAAAGQGVSFSGDLRNRIYEMMALLHGLTIFTTWPNPPIFPMDRDTRRKREKASQLCKQLGAALSELGLHGAGTYFLWEVIEKNLKDQLGLDASTGCALGAALEKRFLDSLAGVGESLALSERDGRVPNFTSGSVPNFTSGHLPFFGLRFIICVLSEYWHEAGGSRPGCSYFHSSASIHRRGKVNKELGDSSEPQYKGLFLKFVQELFRQAGLDVPTGKQVRGALTT